MLLWNLTSTVLFINNIYKDISALKSNDKIPSCVYLKNTNVTTDEDKAKLLNHYFFSVFTHYLYQLSSVSEVAYSIPTSVSMNKKFTGLYLSWTPQNLLE